MKRHKSRGGLVKKLLLTGVIATASIFAKGQATEEEGFKRAMNPYSQPNMHMLEGRDSLDYYGSGDVDNNGTISFEDAQLIRNGTETGNDRADVNGDEIIDNTDATMIDNYVNGVIPYLYGKDWNHSNRQERIEWYLRNNNTEGTGKIDKTDEREYISGEFMCGEFSRGNQINFWGVQNFSNWEHYDKFTQDGDNNARFNMPIYRVATQVTSFSVGGHFIIGFLAGPESGERYAEDPTNFSHWVFFEPQVDLPVVPGDWSINENGYVYIEWFGYSPSMDLFSSTNLITFDLENGEAISFTKNPYMLTTNPNAPDTEAPTADFPEDKTVSSPSSNSLEEIIGSTPPINVTDNMDPNPVVSYTYTSTKTNNGTCSDVSYDVEVDWNIADNADNDTTYTQNIFMRDSGVPEVTNIPDDRQVEYSTSLDLENYVVLNDLSATDNSELEVILEKSRSSTQVIDGSVNQVRFTDIDTIKATDICGNDTTYLVKQEVDDTQPVSGYLTDTYIRRETGQTPEDAIKSLISHDQDNSGLPVDTVITNTSENYYDVELIDIAGNINYLGNVQADYPVGIENPSDLEKACGLTPYPNPNPYGIKYYQSDFGQTEISVYDVSGRQMRNDVYNSSFGENNIEYDFDLPQGVYIVNMKSESCKDSEKIIIDGRK